MASPVPGPRTRRPSWQAVRLTGLLIGAGAILGLALVEQFGILAGPAAPSRAPGPTFNLPAALDAQIDDAGTMRSGGIWVVQGSYLMTSTDNGNSWGAGDIPAPATSVFVLDSDHAWAITAAPSGANAAASGTPGLVLNRTGDGGSTWSQAALPGGVACEAQTLSFVDADHGFLLCSSATVLATGDGGATWSVQGQADGLGSWFTAGDASTLWAAPSYAQSIATGASLRVSRDSGRSWSAVDLPGLGSVPAGSSVSVAAGPVFWDAADGAFALGVAGGSGSGEIWFYRTADAGRTWTLVKKPRAEPLGSNTPNAVVGREWAVLGNDAFGGFAASSDMGANWTDEPCYGLPDNSPLMWVDFTDKDHVAGWVSAAPGATTNRALMLSSDAGQSWHAADFGDARANVPPNSALDPVAATAVAGRFMSASQNDPETAWRMLSSYSQRLFGSYASFQTAEAARSKRVDYKYSLGRPTLAGQFSNPVSLGPALWGDMAAFADTTRSYVLVVSFPGTSEPAMTLVVAPLGITGDWRVWVAPAS